MAFSTDSRVGSLTFLVPLITWLTVAMETPALAATSLMLTFFMGTPLNG